MKVKKKNRIIISICCAFIALVSVFSFIPFKSNKQVDADTVNTSYSFEGSNFSIPLWFYNASDTTIGSVYNSMLKFNFTVNSGASISFSGFGWSSNIGEHNSLWWWFANSGPTGQNSTTYTVSMDNVLHSNYIRWTAHTLDFTPVWFLINSADFTSNIKAVKFSNGRDEPITQFNETHYLYNYIQYIDINDNTFSILLSFYNLDYLATNPNAILPIDYESFYLEPRVYYLSNALDNLDGYTEGFNNGRNQGLTEGESKGYTDGYGVGYIDGKNNGFQLGYEEALVGTNKYSFNGLLTAVIDVPVKTFTSLFNFEILGVNLSGFFLGLLTISIIITVVRFMLGG